MRLITIGERQNTIDLALQAYGSVSALIDLLIDNQLLELDTNLIPGDQLLVQDTFPANANADYANYLNGNGYVVTSLKEFVPVNVLGDNQGDVIAINNTDYLGTD